MTRALRQPEFARRLQHAKDDGLDVLEELLIDMAFTGDTEALTFLLAGRWGITIPYERKGS